MIAVVATLKVKEGAEKEFEAVARELVAKVKAGEPGCKLYALHKADARTYVFLERYEDEAAIEAHRKTDYFKDLGTRMGAYLAGKPEIRLLTEIASS